MINNVSQALEKRCELLPKDKLLLGVSGGPDSLCLLDVLHRLEVPLVVAHLNHQLRPEAGEDARRVQELAESYHLLFVLAEWDVAGYAERHGLSVEEAARTLRYQFLFEQASQHNAQAVAVGHTADDQAETVLMHLLRGAGLSGLKGMQFRSLPNAWSEEIPLVRPLLEIWRADILRYLTDRDLTPSMDRTNLDVTIFRNRLRHELIPYLKSYNPAIRQILWRTAEVLTGDYQVLEVVIEQAWRDCLVSRDSSSVALDFDVLLQKPIGLQRHVMRQAIAELRPGLRDIDFESVERALNFLVNPTATKQLDLIAGLRLLWEGDRLWVTTWEADLSSERWPQLRDKQELVLEIPGIAHLPEGWHFEAELIENIKRPHAQARTNADPFTAWLDADKLPASLKIRTRRPGDRFQPLGMEDHSMKLSDFMVNVKLPRRARARWPIVCAGDKIVWVPGFRLGHPFRITERTKKVVSLRLVREMTVEDN